MLDTQVFTYLLRMYNTCCFSTATMFARLRFTQIDCLVSLPASGRTDFGARPTFFEIGIESLFLGSKATGTWSLPATPMLCQLSLGGMHRGNFTSTCQAQNSVLATRKCNSIKNTGLFQDSLVIVTNIKPNWFIVVKHEVGRIGK